MKKFFFIVSFLVFALSFSFGQTGAVDAVAPVDSTKLPEMTFKVTEHDFGTLMKGADCSFEFVYVNTGKSDLLVTNVKTSCGCTTPTYTQAPVKKKEEGTIKVSYDSNRIGTFNKTVTITSNAKNSPVIISIKGQIVEAPVNTEQTPIKTEEGKQ